MLLYFYFLKGGLIMGLHYSKAEAVLNSSRFLEEPVLKVIKEIEVSPNFIVILTGPRGSGKSIVLKKLLKDQTIPSVFMEVDKDLIAQNTKKINVEVLTYLYQLKIAISLLYYFSSNSSEDKHHYQSFLKKCKASYYELLAYLDNKSSNLPVNSFSLEELVPEVKGRLDLKTLSLVIDSFDLLSNKASQVALASLSLASNFDKLIITGTSKGQHNNNSCDNKFNFDLMQKDDSLKNSKELPSKTLVDISYGKDLNIAKTIVLKDLEYCLENNLLKDPEVLKDFITCFKNNDLFLKYLTLCRGNFNLFFEFLKKVVYSYHYNVNNINSPRLDKIFFRTKTNLVNAPTLKRQLYL